MSDFDIKEYKFSDGSIELQNLITCEDELCFTTLFAINPFGDFVFNKQDAIEIAKHFKLTEEDLS